MDHHDCYVCGKDLGGCYQYHWDQKCHMECHPDNVAARQERERFKDIGRKEAQAEIARLQAEVDRLESVIVRLGDGLRDAGNRLDTAWNDAIDAALEKLHCLCADDKASIRALKRPN